MQIRVRLACPGESHWYLCFRCSVFKERRCACALYPGTISQFRYEIPCPKALNVDIFFSLLLFFLNHSEPSRIFRVAVKFMLRIPDGKSTVHEFYNLHPLTIPKEKHVLRFLQSVAGQVKPQWGHQKVTYSIAERAQISSNTDQVYPSLIKRYSSVVPKLLSQK